MEKKILAAAIQNRESFDLLGDFEVEKDLSPEGKVVWNHLKSFYERDSECLDADMEIVKSATMRSISNPKHQEIFRIYMEGIPESVSSQNLLSEIAAVKRDRVGQELAGALATNKDNKIIEDLIGRYLSLGVPDSLVKEKPEVHIGWDLGDLIEKKFRPENLIKLAPKPLNERAEGGVMRGDHLVVFACTEMGKTLFAVNLMAGFLRQGLKVLYVGNEEPVARVNMRLVTRLLNRPKFDILELDNAELTNVSVVLDRSGYRRFHCVDLSPGTLNEIKSLVDEYGVDVLVVDQLRNLEINSDNRVNQLERAATGIRNIGKEKDVLAISLTQAGDSADGKSVLGRGDVDYSNVGIPGQADMLIGIGGTEEMEANGIRCVSFPKNKNGSHEPFMVQLFPEISKVVPI